MLLESAVLDRAQQRRQARALSDAGLLAVIVASDLRPRNGQLSTQAEPERSETQLPTLIRLAVTCSLTRARTVSLVVVVVMT